MCDSSVLLDRFRSKVDTKQEIQADLADANADPGTLLAGVLRRVVGPVTRVHAMSPRLCAVFVGDDDESQVCVWFKTRHRWVDEATIERLLASTPVGRTLDCVGVVEYSQSQHECHLHAVAFALGDAWLHEPLRADLEPVRFVETLPLAEQRRLENRANGERTRSGARNASRAAKFVRFVVDRCGGMRGLSALLGGSCVLDIAGGNGAVSFELMRRQVSSVVVDPRRTVLPVEARRSVQHYADTQVKGYAAEMAAALLADAAADFELLNSSGVAAKDGSVSLRAINTTFDAQFLVNHASLWERTALCLGLHPDEPTEWIVDFCLAARKSFFVVPCCVFPKAAGNEHRAHITRTEEFVEFLRQKAPDRIRVDALTMGGRNQVVWCTFQ
jgi:hypothetical protein